MSPIRDRHALADDPAKRNGGSSESSSSWSTETAATCPLAREALQEQGILPEGGVDCDEPSCPGYTPYLQALLLRCLRQKLEAEANRVLTRSRTEMPLAAHRNMHPRNRLAFGHPRQELARDLRQQRPRQNVIHVARPAFDFGAALGDAGDQGFVVGELRAMVFQQPACGCDRAAAG